MPGLPAISPPVTKFPVIATTFPTFLTPTIAVAPTFLTPPIAVAPTFLIPPIAVDPIFEVALVSF